MKVRERKPRSKKKNWFIIFRWKSFQAFSISAIHKVSLTAQFTEIYRNLLLKSFIETQSFLRVSGYSVKTLQKHCVSTKFPHKEIRWNSYISCSVSCIFYLKNLFNTIKAIHITNSKIEKQEAPSINPNNPPTSANIP